MPLHLSLSLPLARSHADKQRTRISRIKIYAANFKDEILRTADLFLNFSKFRGSKILKFNAKRI